MVLGGLIKGRADHLAFDKSAHVGDLFGPLVDQKNHQADLRMIDRDSLSDRLDDRGLSGLRRGDDQAALTLSNRGDQVDDPGGNILWRRLHSDALIREERGQRLKVATSLILRRGGAVAIIALDPEHAPVLFAFLRRANQAIDSVARFESKPLDLRLADIDVLRRREVVVSPQKSPSVVKDFEDAATIKSIGVGLFEQPFDHRVSVQVQIDFGLFGLFGQFRGRHLIVVVKVDLGELFEFRRRVGSRQTLAAFASASTILAGSAFRSETVGHERPAVKIEFALCMMVLGNKPGLEASSAQEKGSSRSRGVG